MAALLQLSRGDREGAALAGDARSRHRCSPPVKIAVRSARPGAVRRVDLHGMVGKSERLCHILTFVVVTERRRLSQ